MAQGMTIERNATLAVRDPARGGVVAELPVADAGDVAAAVSRARAGSWSVPAPRSSIAWSGRPARPASMWWAS
jgi:acyl-CoA reductase-like NAD-dependent aldehyde dehydrogenase